MGTAGPCSLPVRQSARNSAMAYSSNTIRPIRANITAVHMIADRGPALTRACHSGLNTNIDKTNPARRVSIRFCTTTMYRVPVPGARDPAHPTAGGASSGEPVGLRPTKAPEDAGGRSRRTSDLDRVFRGAVATASRTRAGLSGRCAAGAAAPCRPTWGSRRLSRS